VPKILLSKSAEAIKTKNFAANDPAGPKAKNMALSGDDFAIMQEKIRKE